MQSSPDFLSRLISWHRPCLSRTCSPGLCHRNLSCLLPLDFPSARFLCGCCLAGLPLQRILCRSALVVSLPPHHCFSRFCNSKGLNHSGVICSIFGSELTPVTHYIILLFFFSNAVVCGGAFSFNSLHD